MTGSMRSTEADKMPLTPQPSLHNILAGIYNNLPPLLRKQFPLPNNGKNHPSSAGEQESGMGTGDGLYPRSGVDNTGGGSERVEAIDTNGAKEQGPPVDPRGDVDWTDISFVYAIPGEDDDEGLVILADGSLRKYIGCKGVNALLFDEADCEGLARNFKEFANSCESDVQIIIKSRNLPVDEYLSRYQNQVTTDNEYLKWYARNTDQWFRRVQDVHFVPQRDFYIVISYTPPDTVNIDNDIWSTIYNHVSSSNSWSGKRTAAKHEEYVECLNRLTRTAFEQLRQSNLRPQILKRSEVRDLIYASLNPGIAEKEPKAPPSRPDLSEASVLAQSALQIHNEHLWLDSHHIGTHYMSQPPHETWMGWLVDLLSLNVEYTLSIFVHSCNQDKVRKALTNKYRYGVMANTQLGTAPDLEGIESTRSAASAIQEFLRSSNKAFDLSMYISTIAETPEKLVVQMDEIRRVFKNRGAIMDRGQLLQLDAWQSTLPVGVDKLAIVHQVMSPVVGTFWPFFSASCGTPDGVPFGFAIASREPVLLNPFYRGAGKDANNMFVVGTTGAGKSFAVSMLILRLLPIGTRFVLMDKTVDKYGAYRFITQLLGPELAAYIDLGPNSGFILNPFDLGPEDKPGEPSADKISTLLSLLDLMLAPEGREELSVEEKSLLDGLIRVAYMDANFRNTVPTMTDLARVAGQAAADEVDPMQRDRLQQMARGLSLYTRSGAFGGLVDGFTNIDTEKLFMVFDTREVNEPRLERIAVFILAEFIRRRAAEYKERRIRFAAVIDEAATLMRFKAGARLLDDLSRRARHYGMMLVSITQQLKDFFRQSEQADSVVKNAHMKVILRQDASDLKVLKETLRLTDAEVTAIDNFSKDEEKRKDSQCLLIVGSSHGTIRLVPSPMDYWICTSEPIHDIPKRMEKIKEVQEKNPQLNQWDAARQSVYYLGLTHE